MTLKQLIELGSRFGIKVEKVNRKRIDVWVYDDNIAECRTVADALDEIRYILRQQTWERKL